MSDVLGEKAYLEAKKNTTNISNMNIQLGLNTTNISNIVSFLPVSANNNVYTLDLSKNYNFAFETLDTNAKTLAFSNVPATANLIISLSAKMKYTNAATITFPASVIWQDGIVPNPNAGKQYLLTFISYDNGVSWLGSWVGAW